MMNRRRVIPEDELVSHNMRYASSCVGLLSYLDERGEKRVDVFDRLNKVSKKALAVFTNLKFHRIVRNNVCSYIPEWEMSKTDKEVMSRCICELRDVGLVRPVIRRMMRKPMDITMIAQYKKFKRLYVINPDYIRCTYPKESKYIWDRCYVVSKKKSAIEIRQVLGKEV